MIDDAPGPTPARPGWLRILLRLWCLREAGAPPTGSARAMIVVLLLGWGAAWVGIDHWQRQPDPQFAVDGVPMLAWYVLGLLGLAVLLRSCVRPRPTLAATFVVALGAVPMPLLLMAVGIYLIDIPAIWWVSGAVALYESIYLLRALKLFSGRSHRLAALCGLLFVVAFIWASNSLNAIPDVWNPLDQSAAVSEDTFAEREAALFEQADRIDAALETIRRDASPSPQAFFLGFAGVGDEKVFAQEIELAAHVIGDRFGVGERRLALINDERDLDQAPLASVSGLRYALKGLAARMDLDKDVLFLAISSHGSEDPAIAVADFDFPLQSLSAPELADALREAGIRWRVVIISACYAGGFIDALRDPRTIVLTAAAADRTSFGCSSDSDLTYFGEAFYRDALPHAASLRDAFDTAKAAIAIRERNEHVTPSNPQAWFGAELEKKLNGSGR
jgi:hypothetical protein